MDFVSEALAIEAHQIIVSRRRPGKLEARRREFWGWTSCPSARVRLRALNLAAARLSLKSFVKTA